LNLPLHSGPQPTDAPHASLPIGVFDSGIGGLSILKALHSELPQERFVYVADSGFAPYGERDETHVQARALSITQHLLQQHRIKALVVACNTATALAIYLLRNQYPQLPIVGIEPALKPAIALSKTGVIGVMATRGTLESDKFKRLLSSLQGQARFVLQPCSGLALAIEQFDALQIQAACAEYIGALGAVSPFGTQHGQIDTLVLGCTHYPFAEAALRLGTGPAVNYLEGGEPVARQTRRLLEATNALNTTDIKQTVATSQVTFYSTGDGQTLQSAVQRWLGLQQVVEPFSD
jgi:glutamate racemase